MTKGSIDITTNYDETTIANKLTSNNINIRTGNNLNSVSTIINDTTIDTVDTLMNLNNIKLDIGNGIGIAVAEEKHEHEHIHDTWGGDIGRAALGGAITGLASGIGIKGGEFLGKLASGSLGNLVGQTTSKVVGSMVNASVASYSTSIGSAMANTTIYGGDFGDVMKAGWKSAGDKDTWKSVAITGAVVGSLAYFVNATGGEPNTNSGSYKDSKMGINTIKDVNGKVYLENMPGIKGEELTGFNKAIYDSKIFSIYDNNPIMKGLNTIPTLESGVAWHDLSMGFIEQNLGVNFGTQIIKMTTAVPYLLINSCVASPELCSTIINSDNFKMNINNDFNNGK